MPMSTLEDFEFLGQLGQGSYGRVFRVRRRVDNGVYVLKQVAIAGLTPREQQDAINEVQVMASVSSPHVVRYYDSFLDKGQLNIVMELCEGGDLHHMLRALAAQGRRLSDDMVWYIFTQVLLGIAALHQGRILHRDLKTMNIFISHTPPPTSVAARFPAEPAPAQSDAEATHSYLTPPPSAPFTVKIGDLGVAKVLQSSSGLALTVIGTPYYLSPELCQNRPYGTKSDCWALGCILYELCALTHPFTAVNQGALVLKIIKGAFAPLPRAHYSSVTRAAVDALLRRAAAARPAAATLLAAPAVLARAAAVGLAYEPPALPPATAKAGAGARATSRAATVAAAATGAQAQPRGARDRPGVVPARASHGHRRPPAPAPAPVAAKQPLQRPPSATHASAAVAGVRRTPTAAAAAATAAGGPAASPRAVTAAGSTAAAGAAGVSAQAAPVPGPALFPVRSPRGATAVGGLPPLTMQSFVGGDSTTDSSVRADAGAEMGADAGQTLVAYGPPQAAPGAASAVWGGSLGGTVTSASWRGPPARRRPSQQQPKQQTLVLAPAPARLPSGGAGTDEEEEDYAFDFEPESDDGDLEVKPPTVQDPAAPLVATIPSATTAVAARAAAAAAADGAENGADEALNTSIPEALPARVRAHMTAHRDTAAAGAVWGSDDVFSAGQPAPHGAPARPLLHPTVASPVFVSSPPSAPVSAPVSARGGTLTVTRTGRSGERVSVDPTLFASVFGSTIAAPKQPVVSAALPEASEQVFAPPPALAPAPEQTPVLSVTAGEAAAAAATVAAPATDGPDSGNGGNGSDYGDGSGYGDSDEDFGGDDDDGDGDGADADGAVAHALAMHYTALPAARAEPPRADAAHAAAQARAYAQAVAQAQAKETAREVLALRARCVALCGAIAGNPAATPTAADAWPGSAAAAAEARAAAEAEFSELHAHIAAVIRAEVADAAESGLEPLAAAAAAAASAGSSTGEVGGELHLVALLRRLIFLEHALFEAHYALTVE